MSDRCTFITTVAAMSSAILASSASAKASTAIKLNREKENRVSQINLFEYIFENGPANNSTAESLTAWALKAGASCTSPLRSVASFTLWNAQRSLKIEMDAMLRLRADCSIVIRTNGFVVLGAPGSRAVRTGTSAISIVNLLRDGVSYEQLEMAATSQNVRSLGALRDFVGTLSAAGLLEGSMRSGRSRRFEFDIDPYAATASSVLLSIPHPLRLLIVCGILVADGAGLMLVTLRHEQPFFLLAFNGLDIAAAACVLLVFIPMHEFAHAVACRLLGVRVTAAGVGHGRGLLGAYVDTTGIYAIESRFKRALVPAAGPFIDLNVIGASAWILLIGPASAGHFAAYVNLIGTFILLSNLNPFRMSDGAHVIEALADDEMLRYRALASARRNQSGNLTGRGAVVCYRLLCIAYLVLCVLVGCWLTQNTYALH